MCRRMTNLPPRPLHDHIAMRRMRYDFHICSIKRKFQQTDSNQTNNPLGSIKTLRRHSMMCLIKSGLVHTRDRLKHICDWVCIEFFLPSLSELSLGCLRVVFARAKKMGNLPTHRSLIEHAHIHI